MNEAPLFPALKSEHSATPLVAPNGGAKTATIDTPSPSPTPDLFGKPTATSTNSAVNSSGIVNAVVSQNSQEKSPILGPKPKTSGGLDVRAGHFNLGAFLFKISIVLALLVYGYFYIQLQANFTFLDPNPAQKLATYETSFEGEQTSVNLYNLLMAKFALSDFTVSADAYLLKLAQYESEYTSSNDRTIIGSEMNELNGDMIGSLKIVQEKLRNHIYPLELVTTTGASVIDLESQYITLLKTRISSEKQSLRDTDDEESALESSNLDGALALLNAKELQRDIRGLNLEEDLSFDTVKSLFEQTTAISKDQTSTILAIKNNRLDWQALLDEVKTVTKKVDPLFGSGIASNISYSNYSFNNSNLKVSLRGETRTDDSLNFSVISDLVDELELSTYFADVTTRSFTKSESTEDGYTASFSLEMTLQKGDDSRDTVVQPVVVAEPSAATETVATADLTTEIMPADDAELNTGGASLLDILKGLFGGSEKTKTPVPRVTNS